MSSGLNFQPDEPSQSELKAQELLESGNQHRVDTLASALKLPPAELLPLKNYLTEIDPQLLQTISSMPGEALYYLIIELKDKLPIPIDRDFDQASSQLDRGEKLIGNTDLYEELMAEPNNLSFYQDLIAELRALTLLSQQYLGAEVITQLESKFYALLKTAYHKNNLPLPQSLNFIPEPPLDPDDAKCTNPNVNYGDTDLNHPHQESMELLIRRVEDKAKTGSDPLDGGIHSTISNRIADVAIEKAADTPSDFIFALQQKDQQALTVLSQQYPTLGLLFQHLLNLGNGQIPL